MTSKRSNIAILGSICIENLEKLKNKSKLYAPYIDYHNRLMYELSVIKRLGYENIFLITRQFIQYSLKKGVIVGPARGSAAGSLVCHTCGITRGVDPIRFNLRFERFLNPDRVTSADIDVDFSDREVPIEFLRKTYGANRVIQVGTRGLFKTKSALDDFAKVFNVSFEDAKKITACFDNDGEVIKPQELEYWEKNHKDLFDTAKFFSDSSRFRMQSKHPSAVIVTDEPVGRSIPLQSVVDSKTGERVLTTEWDGDELESIGYTKFDILRVSVLNVINDTINLINSKEKILPDAVDIFENIPLDDKKTLEMTQRGELIGVFQLWKPECLNLIQSITVKGFEDFYHATTVIRPGIDRDEYIKAHENPKSITYITKELEPILKSTYGIILYQEQMMDICHYLAGFTLAEADSIRKVLAKTNNTGDKLSLKPYEDKFINGCLKNGIEQQAAASIWGEILKRQRYSFNLAHAVAYSLISYVCAYLKAHYPLQFLTACLNDKNEDRFIEELRRLGFKILPPCVNKSSANHTVEDGCFRIGISHIKDIGKSAEVIEKYKPYSDYNDFITRTRLGSNVIDALTAVGALDALSKFELDQKAVKIDSGKRALIEKDYLGYFVTCHPLDDFKEQLKGTISEDNSSAKVKIGGIITRIKQHMPASGKAMAFVNLQTRSSDFECVIWHEEWTKVCEKVKVNSIVICEGVKTQKGNRSLQNIVVLR